MANQHVSERLSSAALQWATAQEALILQLGAPLAPRQFADAQRAGVQNPARVRLLVVDRIPLPDDEELAEAPRRARIITEASRAVALGHGIMIRADCWQDRELLLHQLVHVAQCERAGGLEPFVVEYLNDRASSADFSMGSLEDEARKLARQLCESDRAGVQTPS